MSPMLERSPLPSRHALRTLVENLTGRDVDLKDANLVPAKTTNLYAVYVTDKLAVSAVCVVNLECGARLGGALAMLPKGSVDEAIAARDLPPMMRDCCHEVLNVLASLFNVPNAPHVRLYELYGPNGTVPPDVAALAATLGSRLDVQLTIAGYGDGLLSVVVR